MKRLSTAGILLVCVGWHATAFCTEPLTSSVLMSAHALREGELAGAAEALLALYESHRDERKLFSGLGALINPEGRSWDCTWITFDGDGCPILFERNVRFRLFSSRGELSFAYQDGETVAGSLLDGIWTRDDAMVHDLKTHFLRPLDASSARTMMGWTPHFRTLQVCQEGVE